MRPFRADIPPHVAEAIKSLHPDLKRSIKSAIRAIAVDPECGDAQLAWSLDVAGQAGIFAVYEPIARKELKRKKDELTKLKRGAAGMIEKANDAA